MTDTELELSHPSDIAAVLEELVAAGVPLHLSPPGGGSMALAPLRHEVGQALLLRLPMLQAPPAWLLHGPVHAHAQLARVRIDFELGTRQLVQVDGRPLLRLAAPTRLLRHQRRQAFRVHPNSSHYPRLLLDGASTERSLRVQDISTGGLALRWPSGHTPPEPDQAYTSAQLELTREARLLVDLRVQHVRDDRDGCIVGCAFTRLPPQGERMLQQHMNQLQRRQRTLAV